MKLPFFVTLVFLFSTAGVLRGAESMDDAMKRAAVDYGQRLGQANTELIQARERIAREKTPLVGAMRKAEDRTIAAQTEITQLETQVEQASGVRRKLVREADAAMKSENYLKTLAHDSLAAFTDGLRPGEAQFLPATAGELSDGFIDPAKLRGPGETAAVVDLLLGQVQRSIGGYRAAGLSQIDGDSKLIRGTFAFVRPEVFFRTEQGAAGTVRVREGTGSAVTFLLPQWNPAAAEALFQGRPGTMLADASGGKALRLQETTGTVWQHVKKGGIVSYAILGVGLIALLLLAQKIRDLSQMSIDDPKTIQRCLDAVGSGAIAEAGQLVHLLKATPRELFVVGLRYRAESREILEERLTAVLLKQRLHYERWLPLLAVIATAAPLMGLLGTVTGMVRTFTLITVFGTGNAGKLASGISEVLVATELGLMVAIPTLIAHSFLSQRIQKNLSLLERYALEFVTAVQAKESKNPAKEAVVP